MDYQELFEKENDYLIERFELARGRIRQIAEEGISFSAYKEYFSSVSSFLLLCYQLFDEKLSGDWKKLSLAEKREENQKLYQDILPGKEGYDKSFAEPLYAEEKLGEYGPILSFLYAELRGAIVYSFEGRFEQLVIFSELFLQIACLFEEQLPSLESVKDAIYWFYHDYSEIFSEQSVRNTVDPSLSFAKDIIMQADLEDLSYLYEFGEYISDTEIELAEFLNGFSEEMIQKMADTYTEGYRKGFELAGIDLSKKKTVNIRYNVGFERMIRAAIRNFEKMGLDATIYRASPTSFSRNGSLRIGFCSLSPNPQYDFDHANDQSFYLDKALVKRRLETLKVAYEKYKKEALEFAGPAVVEVFGEIPFVPEMKEGRSQFSEKQQELRVYQTQESGRITNTYIPGDQRSFTIIAYPIPSIGTDFEEIFRKTAEINTLDYEKYQRIQQKLIDALDQGRAVHVKGKGENQTDITVLLWKLEDPSSETIFENCVADVNIPVGEVFTSPVLEGTEGLLHVSKVYLNGLEYRDLKILIKDGIVTEYSLSNFEDEEENKKYFRSNVLYDHAFLPLGEFAIGTNTTAYRMGKDYDIADKLPILIAEKTGPHFALGDTCYSHQEDMITYNPDGKKIVARSNRYADLREEDPSKAYFNCHTDITLPFEELACIEVLKEDGSRIDLIRDGRFVLPGTEELNIPLEGI